MVLDIKRWLFDFKCTRRLLIKRQTAKSNQIAFIIKVMWYDLEIHTYFESWFFNIYSAKIVTFHTKKSSPGVLGLCPHSTLFQAFPEAALWFCFHLLSIPLLLLSASIPPLPPRRATLPTLHQPKSMSNINIPLEILLYRSMNNKVKLCSAFLWGTKLVNNTTWNHGSLMIVHSLLYLSSFSLVMIISRTVFCP